MYQRFCTCDLYSSTTQVFKYLYLRFYMNDKFFKMEVNSIRTTALETKVLVGILDTEAF